MRVENAHGLSVLVNDNNPNSLLTKVKWKKDGKSIIPSAKHRIAPGGSLYIKKINEQDAGRYECSVVNSNGRATAAGLVTIR